MVKIMFDSNAFDKFIELDSSINFSMKNNMDYEYYITPIQVEELARIPDDKKEKRITNFLHLCEMRATLLPIPGICGIARCGTVVVAGKDDIDVLYKLGNGTNSHLNDDLIGTVAKREGCTVITNDKEFIKRLSSNDISTMTFEAWWATIKC